METNPPKFAFKKFKSAQKRLDSSEKRTNDIVQKIGRLANGKIRTYQLHHKNDVMHLAAYCANHKIIAYVKSRVTQRCSRLYEVDELATEAQLEEFYALNWKPLEQEGDVYLVVFKGFVREKGNRFVLCGTNQAALL